MTIEAKIICTSVGPNEITVILKLCCRCKSEKVLTEFNKDPSLKGGLRSFCRDCQKKEHKIYYSKNRQKVCVDSSKWAKTNREKVKKSQLKWRETNKEKVKAHGLKLYWPDLPQKDRLLEYNKLLIKCENKCGICEKTFNQSPNVDHCHNTNKVRGLLCRACNLGLGNFEDSIIYLKNAISYMEKY